MTPHELDCFEAYKNFNRKRNFSKEIPNCVWDIEIELPEPPEDPTEIQNFGLPKKKRKFPYYSKQFKNKIDKLDDDDQEKIDFLKQEWNRRRNGFWFYNGDRLEWINGHYYMTLQYWLIPIEDEGGASNNPKFVDMHRDMNLAIWWTKKNPKYSGSAFIGARRSSKTIQGMANAYWDTTEKYNAVCGIQSKTGTDAKKVLGKLVSSWRRLPKFLKPIDTGETTVTQKLRFFEPKKRSTKGEEKEYQETLDSYIEAFSSKAEAMDGLRTSFQFIDEFGKVVDMNVAELQKIAKVCCFAGAGKIVGYSFWATTVEEMERKGGKNAKKVWDDSDVNNLTDNGRTKTTMNRLFFPCFYGMYESPEGEEFLDEWGYSNMDNCVAWLDKEESNLEDEDLLDWRRKFPREINDCFKTLSGGNAYNKHNLYVQMMHNENVYNNPVVVGDFYWKDGDRYGEVAFKPSAQGKWRVAWMPPEDDRNKYGFRDGQRYAQRDYCVTGVDPYSHKVTMEKGSDGAIVTIVKRHHESPAINKGIACIYVNRPSNPHEFYDDILKQICFYSSPVLVENNKYGFLDFAHKEGWDGFTMRNPLETDPKIIAKNQKGINMTSRDNRNALMDNTLAYIHEHIGKNEESNSYGYCYFNELLQEWYDFDPEHWTPFDLAVAAGVALIGCKTPSKRNQELKFQFADYIPRYKVVGKKSVRF